MILSLLIVLGLLLALTLAERASSRASSCALGSRRSVSYCAVTLLAPAAALGATALFFDGEPPDGWVGALAFFALGWTLFAWARSIRRPLEPWNNFHVELQGEHRPRLRYEVALETPRRKSKGIPISLLFAGDLMPTRLGVTLAPDVDAFVRSHHFRFLNLEGPVVARPLGDGSKTPSTLPLEGLAETLFSSGKGTPSFNVLGCVDGRWRSAPNRGFGESLAHVQSFGGVTALTSDLQVLSLAQLKMGVLACTAGHGPLGLRHPQVLFEDPWVTVNRPHRSKLLARVREAHQQVDLLVLSYHWGYQAEFCPSSLQRECWLALAEAGVHIVYGHRSHIVQPFEIDRTGRSLCLYSCGNIASDMEHRVFREGVLFSVKGTLYPTHFALRSVRSRFLRYDRPVVSFTQGPSEAEERFRQYLAQQPRGLRDPRLLRPLFVEPRHPSSPTPSADTSHDGYTPVE